MITKLNLSNQAMWIWNRHGEDKQNKMVLFTKKFEINKIPSNYEICVCADSRYVLEINDKIVSRGPCRHKDRYRYIDTVDISSYLCNGNNSLKIYVIHYADSLLERNNLCGVPVSIEHTTLGGLLVSDNGYLQLNSNETWSCVEVIGYKFVLTNESLAYVGYSEQVDFRCNYDVNNFCHAVVQYNSNPYIMGGLANIWMLSPRPIPFPYEQEKRFCKLISNNIQEGWNSLIIQDIPLTVPTNSSVAVWLDPGEYETAFPYLEIEGGIDSTLKLGYTEKYDDDSIRCLLDGKRLVDQFEDVYYLDGECRSISTYYYRAFRFCLVSIQTKSEPLTVHKIHYKRTGYPLKVDGNYKSNDEQLNMLWQISLRTLKRCMYETYVDCPYYEQMQYTMDTMLEMLYSFQVSSDDRLARKAILDFSLSLTPNGIITCNAPANFIQIIPGFTVYWVLMLYFHYQYYGDISFVKEYVSALEGVLNFFKNHIDSNTGLIVNTGYWQFVDWVDGWEKGCPSIQNDNYIYSMMAATMFNSAGLLYQALGYHDRKNECDEIANKLCRQLNIYAWDEHNQLYRDSPNSRQFSQHAQLWAVLGNVCEDKPGRSKDIMYKAMTQPLLKVSYCMSFFLFRALEKVEMYKNTLPLWNDWKLIAKNGATTWKEDSISNRSECHAWGSVPLYDFAACYLGVYPKEPGYKIIGIAPRALWLKNCEGTVATCRGPINIKWTLLNNNLHIEVSLPESCDVVLSLPNMPDQEYHQIVSLDKNWII